MPMMTMLDRVILRAADDVDFRKMLLADPDAALATLDDTLSDYEYEALNAYRREASRMLAEQELHDHYGYRASEQDSAAGLM
jgi:hypothetical protein